MTYQKKDYPVSAVRRFLEPGPVVLISTQWKTKTNIMTMAWQTVLEFSPSLVGLMISGANHTFHMLKQSRGCVINIPTEDMIDKIIDIGTSTGSEIDKFEAFGLTATASELIDAPSIAECYANFECKLYDDVMVDRYNFFIMEVVKAKVAASPKYPKTVHYRGNGIFMHSGKNVFHSEKLRNM
ncbi:flavin reductase family protein [Olivibacter sitiensis]|uniref:flavin reductase family protein n=1 Tax=Olivibacter sitiensis TaxID=376470 RepID=UPI00040ECE2A|nr:flavin reductase family protein [Olivibacter sitiensis]